MFRKAGPRLLTDTVKAQKSKGDLIQHAETACEMHFVTDILSLIWDTVTVGFALSESSRHGATVHEETPADRSYTVFTRIVRTHD
jgi:hypothetical protein